MNATSKSTLQIMNIIYMAMIMMMTAFGAIVFFLNSSDNKTSDPTLTLTLRYTLFVILPIGLGAGYFIFKHLMNTINPALTLREKLMKYQSALLIRSACFETPGLAAAAFALVSGDNSFLLFTAIVLILFLLMRPSIPSISNDLNLTQSESMTLQNPNSPL